MKLAICNDLFQGWSQSDIFRFAAVQGYDAIEIAPFMYAERVEMIDLQTRENIKEEAERLGLEITGLHWVLVGPDDVYLTHPRPEVREKTRDYLLELVKFCADIGGEVIVFGSPQQRNLQTGVSREEGFHYAADVFGGCMDYAAARGVTICIEPLGEVETNFITSIDQAVELVRLIDHPNFRTMLDVKAALTESRAVEELIRTAADYLYHVHLNDAEGLAPGYGQTDFARVIEQLKAVGYKRYLSLEIFELQAGIKETAEYCYQYLSSMIT